MSYYNSEEKNKFVSVKNDILRELVFGLPLILFAYFAICKPVGVYNDTYQYVAMHIHRDPLYCLFLMVIRNICGEAEWYMNVAVWLQNILAFLSVRELCKSVRDTQKLNTFETFVVCVISTMPHIITPLASNSGLVLSNSIMSEAITMPLFYFFAASVIRMLKEYRSKSKWTALVMGILLSLARGQMLPMLIVWLVVEIYMVIISKRDVIIRLSAMVVVFILAVGSRTLIVRSYNLAFNNYFTNTTLGEVSILTNILYAADYNPELIDDDEAREFYIAAAQTASINEYGYKSSPEGFINRALDLENTHDPIKFECMDELWRLIHDEMSEKLRTDYEWETMEQDRIAGIIIKDIWPSCFGRWLYDYFALVTVGLIRTVAIVHPVMYAYTILVYIMLIAGLAYMLSSPTRREENRMLIRLCLFSIMAVCANAFATAIVIMCLSRYMVYTLPLFYISLFLIVAKVFKMLMLRIHK